MGLSLTLSGIEFKYDGMPVLADVELEVQEGDFLGLIGPNGSGKSTLLKIISRVLRPQKGVAYLNGSLLDGLSQKAIARDVAVVPQETQTSFGFSVSDVVLMGRFPHLGRFQVEGAEDLRIARGAMEKTHTVHLADRPITELSGGEKQRVIIAQALTQNPRLLLLDEPTTHLDINHQLQILDLLKELNRGGLTIIAVFHDLNLAARYCKRLVLLNCGRIDVVGKAQEVLLPEIIRRVFKTDVVVERSAITEAPQVTPIRSVDRA